MAEEVRMTKTQAVLNHMRKFGTISSMEAFEKYGATRLSAIIFCLRKQGFLILNKEKECTDRFGRKVKYVDYKLIKEPN